MLTPTEQHNHSGSDWEYGQDASSTSTAPCASSDGVSNPPVKRNSRRFATQPGTLQHSIKQLAIRSEFPARRDNTFIPVNQARQLVSIDAVRRELRVDPASPADAALVNWIINDAKNIFLAHIHSGIKGADARESLLNFMEVKVTDATLHEHVLVSDDEYLPPQGGTEYFDHDCWNSQYVREGFFKFHWMLRAPEFKGTEKAYRLDKREAWPIVECSEKVECGNFSEVYQVTLHKDHHTYGYEKVAIKYITFSDKDRTANGETEWDFEYRNLRLTNGVDHDHIIRFLDGVKQGRDRYFIFPWANGGSLADFWGLTAKREPDEKTISDSIKQIRGLADALSHLHNINGDPTASVRTPVPHVMLESQSFEMQDDSLRHGDLKPENILRFLDEGAPGHAVGVLKMADLGLARQHHIKTAYRKVKTTTKFSTVLYEAPEAEINKARSRLYDIWSMGCITLQFIIWILWGNEKVIEMLEDMAPGNPEMTRFFELKVLGNGTKVAKVDPQVQAWIASMRKNDPECKPGCAIGDLLEVVETKLLVVHLPPTHPSDPGTSKAPRYRATAEELRISLDRIISHFEDEGYLLTSRDRKAVKPPGATMSPTLATAEWGVVRRDGPSLGPKPSPENNNNNNNNDMWPQSSRISKPDYSMPDSEDWVFVVDNVFAKKAVQNLDLTWAYDLGNQRNSCVKRASLCAGCKGKKIEDSGYTFSTNFTMLKQKSYSCDLCKLLYDIPRRYGIERADWLTFNRIQSTLQLGMIKELTNTPAGSLALIAASGTGDDDIQMGIPHLLQPGTGAYFGLLRLWLEDCDTDKKHSGCEGNPNLPLPKRLIFVGSKENHIVRLVETTDEGLSNVRYLALSHPWGDEAKHPPFKTLNRDESGRGRELSQFKKAIVEDTLPATFKDAIRVTRELGIQYLWIDSICIIQGPGGDFNEESKSMENVFSGAYCVIAATRAEGQHDGFLQELKSPTYWEISSPADRSSQSTGGGQAVRPSYIYESIDNFEKDVLDSPLNQRGWVLQERGLARRTIFFAKTQTYFECGQGVRCQTLTKMQNYLASFLGDPKFPKKALNGTRGEQIRYFMSLYKKYSRLHFTRWEDRPIAIKGLEDRLGGVFKKKSFLGIFDDGPNWGLFHRSLLWRRAGDNTTPLVPIRFPPEREVPPTWSWMHYRGAIDYIEPPNGGATWEEKDVQLFKSRLAQEKRGSTATTTTSGSNTNTTSTVAAINKYDPVPALRVTVRRFRILDHSGSGNAGNFKRGVDWDLFYDRGQQTTTATGKGKGKEKEKDKNFCVIIAWRSIGHNLDDKTHYVLLVGPTADPEVYERIGAGFMPGKFIELNKIGFTNRTIC